MAHGGKNGARVDNTMSYLAVTNTYPPELSCDDTATAQPAGNQATPGLEQPEMLPPAHLHNPIRLFANDIALYYLDIAERGLIQIERPPSSITTQRDYPRVMCITALVTVGLALVTFIGSVIRKTLF
jgi:hypothetical protein